MNNLENGLWVSSTSLNVNLDKVVGKIRQVQTSHSNDLGLCVNTRNSGWSKWPAHEKDFFVCVDRVCSAHFDSTQKMVSV